MTISRRGLLLAPLGLAAPHAAGNQQEQTALDANPAQRIVVHNIYYGRDPNRRSMREIADETAATLRRAARTV